MLNLQSQIRILYLHFLPLAANIVIVYNLIEAITTMKINFIGGNIMSN